MQIFSDLAQLWLPILLSAIGVFIASCVIWMATPLHKGDFTPPPDEEGITAALRTTKGGGFRPGMYFIPWCGSGNMRDPAYLERLKAGPWAVITVKGSPPSFSAALIQWFVFQIVIAFFVAYVAVVALPIDTPVPYLRVFQIVGAVAFLAQAGAVLQDSIWKWTPWRIAVVKIVDGLVYALLTAGFFGWLWPRH